MRERAREREFDGETDRETEIENTVDESPLEIQNSLCSVFPTEPCSSKKPSKKKTDDIQESDACTELR